MGQLNYADSLFIFIFIFILISMLWFILWFWWCIFFHNSVPPVFGNFVMIVWIFSASWLLVRFSINITHLMILLRRLQSLNSIFFEFYTLRLSLSIMLVTTISINFYSLNKFKNILFHHFVICIFNF